MLDDRGGDLELRGLRRGAYIIVGGIVCTLAVAALVLRERGPAANTPPHPFRGETPLLQGAPQPDRAAYLDEKRRLLGSYGWVDREAGIARIPLEEAMRLLAARGGSAPHRAQAAQTDKGRAAPVLATGKEAR